MRGRGYTSPPITDAGTTTTNHVRCPECGQKGLRLRNLFEAYPAARFLAGFDEAAFLPRALLLAAGLRAGALPPFSLSIERRNASMRLTTLDGFSSFGALISLPCCLAFSISTSAFS